MSCSTGTTSTNKKLAPGTVYPGPQLVKKAWQSSGPQARNKEDPFSLATGASGKILLRLHVWDLSACGGQILRAADCTPSKK